MSRGTDLGVVFPRAHERGGVERVAWQLLAHLGEGGRFVGWEVDPRPSGTSVTVVGTGPRPLPAPLRFRLAARRPVTDLRAGRTPVLTLGAECPPGDVLWVQSVHRAFLEGSGPLHVRGRRVPAGARLLLPRHRLLLALEHAYFTRSRPRVVLCTSPREVEDLGRLYGVAERRCVVVPNGVDLAAFSPRRRASLRAEVRAELGMRPEQVSLLFVANELHRKGFATLLEAVALVGDPRLRVDVVGKVDLGGHRPVLERLGLAGQVHAHGPSGDVGRFHAGADVFVLPTTYEPFGIVIVEALASGLPVVTSRLAGASAAVGGAGLLLEDPTDSAELAAALRTVLDGGARDRLGEQGPARAAAYSWDRVLDRVVGLATGD